MQKFRNIATAFLLHENKILLIKRGDHKSIGPGRWFGVGGHIEPEEINNPYAAAYREIFEETGIERNQLEDLELKYIVYNPTGSEIIINHIFFGTPSITEVIESDEGTLHWVDRAEAIEKIQIPAVRLALESYFSEVSKGILLGAVDSTEPYICWCPL